MYLDIIGSNFSGTQTRIILTKPKFVNSLLIRKFKKLYSRAYRIILIFHREHFIVTFLKGRQVEKSDFSSCQLEVKINPNLKVNQ